MTFLPATFRPLHEGWTLTAAALPADAEADAAALAAGVPAAVPGEAHLDLRRAGLIADPFDGDNEAAQQWIGDTSWRYETVFSWTDDGADRHDLVALGLDTVAAVSLNGTEVGRTQNQFRSYRWDVRGLLREGANTLAVVFAAPVPEAAARAERDGALPHTNHHAYNQLRKMACSFGWDWGVDVAGAGIWKPIGLDSWSGTRVAGVRPLVDVVENAEGGHDGVLRVHVDVERARGDGDVDVLAVLTDPDGSPSKPRPPSPPGPPRPSSNCTSRTCAAGGPSATANSRSTAWTWPRAKGSGGAASASAPSPSTPPPTPPGPRSTSSSTASASSCAAPTGSPTTRSSPRSTATGTPAAWPTRSTRTSTSCACGAAVSTSPTTSTTSPTSTASSCGRTSCSPAPPTARTTRCAPKWRPRSARTSRG
nr:hypothetical protein GCM10025732_40080 [Glycomyces mayteni]